MDFETLRESETVELKKLVNCLVGRPLPICSAVLKWSSLGGVA